MVLPTHTIIAAGPVIILDNKVLLTREKKDTGITPWLFPGGEVEQFDIFLEEACIREAKEELGIDVRILRSLKPMIIHRPEKPDHMVILIHFLAEYSGDIIPASNIAEWGWFDLHNLPDDCAPNIAPVIEDFLKTKV